MDAFKRFDLDGSGTIDVVELQEMLKMLGIGDGIKEAENLMTLIDPSSDGEISFHEFIRLVVKLKAWSWRYL